MKAFLLIVALCVSVIGAEIPPDAAPANQGFERVGAYLPA